MRNLELLQQDRLFLEGNERQAVELARATQEHVTAQQRRMVDEAAAQQVGSRVWGGVVAAREGRCGAVVQLQ